MTNGGYRDAVIFGRIPRTDLRARSDRIESIVNHTALIDAYYSERLKIENNASDEMMTLDGIYAPDAYTYQLNLHFKLCLYTI